MFYREKMWDYIAMMEQVQNFKKKIIEIFKKYGLAITIKTNLFVINLLHIQFNLLNSTFKPYRKPNNDPIMNI